MTTFQAIILGIIHGFTQFLPVSSSAHHRLLPYLLSWPEIPEALLAALFLGVTLSLFVYFIHDWASIVSSFLQVVIYRKKPMTLDERMPLFLFFSIVPLAASWFYLRPIIEARADWSNPSLVAAVLAVGAFPLVLAERRSRKNKGMFDWNWIDALVVGITGILGLVPGCGLPEGLMLGALLRNYNREAAAKYCFFAMFPLLAASCYLFMREVSLHGGPSADVSWLSFGVAVVVSFFSGLLAIGGLMKHVQRNGFGQYVIYRLLVAGATGIVFWIRNH